MAEIRWDDTESNVFATLWATIRAAVNWVFSVVAWASIVVLLSAIAINLISTGSIR